MSVMILLQGILRLYHPVGLWSHVSCKAFWLPARGGNICWYHWAKMVLPRSLWLLSVCLLSWCCDARSLGPQDLQLESWQITFVFLHLKGEWGVDENMAGNHLPFLPGFNICKSRAVLNSIWDLETSLYCRESCQVSLVSNHGELCIAGVHAIFIKILASVASSLCISQSD
jgi:hypothetical protein